MTNNELKVGSKSGSQSINRVSLDDKIIVNSVEKVVINGKKFLARIDTGATRSSISKNIAEVIDLGPVIDKVEVRNAHGQTLRDVVKIEVELAGVTLQTKFNISDRSNMKYPVLIGRNLLRQGFLVDCSNEGWDN
jgi:hypothetical protein